MKNGLWSAVAGLVLAIGMSCTEAVGECAPDGGKLGVCCLYSFTCVITTAADCEGFGKYLGDDTTCDDCPPPPVCPPAEGNCFLPHPTPGCSNIGLGACCEVVCAFADPFCCEIEWDNLCVSGAIDLCGDNHCPPQGGGGCCFTNNGSPGCSDASCCNAVCKIDLFCCEFWDQICADIGLELCFNSSCPGNTNGDGFVDVTDLTNVILNWGTTNLPTDVAPNCIIDVGDLTAVILNWGPCS